MKNLGREATRDLLVLSLVAGSADAAGFMSIGRVFTSNMTGNLVLLGLACGQGQWHDVVRTLYVLTFFIFGVFAGSRIARHFPDSAWRKLMTRLLTVEAILLLAFACYWAFVSEAGRRAQFFWLVSPLAVAMGLQSAAMSRLTIAGVTNTAMTGTLTSLAVGLENLWFKHFGTEAETRRRMKQQLMVILLYCSGAAVEGVLNRYADWMTGFFPALFVFLIVCLHLRG